MYGSDRVLLQIIQGLDRSILEPVVILPLDIQYNGELSSALSNVGVETHHIKMGVLRRRYLHPLRIVKYIWFSLLGIYHIYMIARRHNAKLIHSNTSAIVGGAVAARLLQIPHLWHIHEILDQPAWLSRMIYSLVLGASTVVVAISGAVERQIRHRAFNSAKYPNIIVVWNGVDCDRFTPLTDGVKIRAALSVGDDEILFGLVGRISHWKGQELFLDALAIAIKHNPKLKAAIIGSAVAGEEWREAQLRQQVRENKLDSVVRFMPFSDNAPKIMCALDCLVLPSLLPEPFGLVLLEAMASGRPVIAAAHGGPLEIVIANSTGLLFSPGNTQALAAALERIAQDYNGRITMGKNARQRAVDTFSLTQFQAKFMATYRSLLVREVERQL